MKLETEKSFTYSSNSLLYPFYLFTNSYLRSGCWKCKTGFKPLAYTNNDLVCLDHQFIKSGDLSTIVYGFTKMNFCLNAKGDVLNQCFACRNGKTLTT